MGLNFVSKIDDSVTFKIFMGISVVTNKEPAGSLIIQGESGKTSSFRLFDKEIA